MRSHCDKKARPQMLLKVNNVSAGVLAAFGAGWSCPPPVYLATSGVFTHPDSCSDGRLCQQNLHVLYGF